jgi:hypothetical protein
MRKANGSSGVTLSDKIARLMSREGMSRDRARDHVILESLKRGDTATLAALLIDGHVPAPNVRLVLALMLLDNEEAEEAIAAHNMDPGSWWLPHRLVVKPRPAKPRRAHAPRKHANHSSKLMPDIGYEAAIGRLDQAVRAADGLSEGKPDKRSPPKGRSGSKPKR